MTIFAAALALISTAVDAPISAVTVYSDRARVTRAAQINVGAATTVEMPLLPDGADASSIRVEASGAVVRQVDLEPIEAGDIPLTEGRKLLRQIEVIVDQIAQTQNEREALTAQVESVRRVAPSVPPSEPLKPQPKLDTMLTSPSCRPDSDR